MCLQVNDPFFDLKYPKGVVNGAAASFGGASSNFALLLNPNTFSDYLYNNYGIMGLVIRTRHAVLMCQIHSLVTVAVCSRRRRRPTRCLTLTSPRSSSCCRRSTFPSHSPLTPIQGNEGVEGATFGKDPKTGGVQRISSSLVTVTDADGQHPRQPIHAHHYGQFVRYLPPVRCKCVSRTHSHATAG